MIAYLHERAYAQPVAKLKFHKAAFTEVTKADYEAWVQTKWKDNIVPIGDRDDEYNKGQSFFRGFGFFPKSDPRNVETRRPSCHAMLRVPITGMLQDKIRERWPADKPRYWLIDGSTIFTLQNEYPDQLGGGVRSAAQWNREIPGSQPSFFRGTGVNRPSGVGHIELVLSEVASGQGLRIPYRVETGYPWASDRLLSQTTLDINIDTANGADHGFAYCFRDMCGHYLVEHVPNGQARAVEQRFFIDGQLVATLPNATGRRAWRGDRRERPVSVAERSFPVSADARTCEDAMNKRSPDEPMGIARLKRANVHHGSGPGCLWLLYTMRVRRMGRAQRNPSIVHQRREVMGIASLHPSYS